LLERAANILILAFGATLGAIVIRSLAQLCERYLRLPRRWATVAGMATALAAILFLVWLFAVQFGTQVNQFVTSLPQILTDLRAMISGSPVGDKIIDAIEDAYAGSRIAHDIGGIVTGSAELLLNMILVIVGAFFLAADPTGYRRGALRLIPASRRPAFEDALADTLETLRLWLIAQIILMTSMGTTVGIGLWLAGVPSPAALGLLAGLSEFIPYVGPTVAMIPAFGLAATAGPGAVGGTLATYVVVRLMHTNFITPYVQKRAVSIPPAVTLFAIIGIGTVTGLYGLFFSAALLVVAVSLVRSLYMREVLGEGADDAPPAGTPSL
jgi:predicted PurR-regulated permease PerM